MMSAVLSLKCMGTSFVTITDDNTGDEPGFWMRDEMLELWLRLLSLHLPEPFPAEGNSATHEIRNKWMLASRGYFNGCVPHEMEFACSTPERMQIVFIDSLDGRIRSTARSTDVMPGSKPYHRLDATEGD